MPRFGPGKWLDTVQRQRVTHAMAVPTMLARIVTEFRTRGARGPSYLKSLFPR
jgi:hypothetical protein